MTILNSNEYTNAQFVADGGYGYLNLFPDPIFADLLAELDTRLAAIQAVYDATVVDNDATLAAIIADNALTEVEMQDLLDSATALNSVAAGNEGSQLYDDGVNWVSRPYLTLGAVSAITPATDQTDLAPGAFAVLRATPTAAVTIHSISGGVKGRVLTVENWHASNTITLPHDSATGTAANKFYNAGSADVVLTYAMSATYRYDSVASRWFLIAINKGGASDFDGGSGITPAGQVFDGGSA